MPIRRRMAVIPALLSDSASAPKRVIVPRVGRRDSKISRRRVVLPAPEGPVRKRNKRNLYAWEFGKIARSEPADRLLGLVKAKRRREARAACANFKATHCLPEFCLKDHVWLLRERAAGSGTAKRSWPAFASSGELQPFPQAHSHLRLRMLAH